VSAKVSVIVAGAGSGSRFGGPVKKTFAQIDGRPVMIRALELFVNRDDVCQLILAVGPDDFDAVKTKFGANLGFMGVKLVQGGAHRWQTVRNALAEVKPEADLVAVHDAVRPCLTEERISEVFAVAAAKGAAILAAPVSATLKSVDQNGRIRETRRRDSLWSAQTPQVFKRELIVAAYAALPADGADVTDDAQVLEAAGVPVWVVESDESNLKITRPGDLRLAEAILKALPKPKPSGPAGPWAAEKMW